MYNLSGQQQDLTLWWKSSPQGKVNIKLDQISNICWSCKKHCFALLTSQQKTNTKVHSCHFKWQMKRSIKHWIVQNIVEMTNEWKINWIATSILIKLPRRYNQNWGNAPSRNLRLKLSFLSLNFYYRITFLFLKRKDIGYENIRFRKEAKRS